MKLLYSWCCSFALAHFFKRMYKSVPQNVELLVAPNHYSGRTKLRLSLLIVGMLSFFSVAIFVNYQESTDPSSSIAFSDNHFYFLYNLFMAAFAFSMIPLADFQVSSLSFSPFVKLCMLRFLFNRFSSTTAHFGMSSSHCLRTLWWLKLNPSFSLPT